MTRIPSIEVCIFLFIVIIFRGPSSHAQNTDLDRVRELENKLSRLYSSGQTEEILPIATEILRLNEKLHGPEHQQVAIAANNLGQFLHQQGKYEEADIYYHKALLIAEKVLGSQHALASVILYNLGTLYLSQGRYKDSEVFLKRSLAIREKDPGQKGFELGAIYRNLAMVLYSQGYYDQAGPLFAKALPALEESLGPGQVETRHCLQDMASFYESMRDYEKAEILLKKSFTSLVDSGTPDLIELADSSDRLASFYESVGGYAYSEVFRENIAKVFKGTLDQKHPIVSRNLENLLELYRKTGMLYRNLGEKGKSQAIDDLVKTIQTGDESPVSSSGLLPVHETSILAQYQMSRGPAEFDPPGVSSFDERGSWENIGGQGIKGSWRPNSFEKTRSMAVHEGRLFVGLTRPSAGGAQVWSYSGATWEKEAGARKKGSWQDSPARHSSNVLISAGEELYCGIGGSDPMSAAEVWAFRKGKWRQVGGPGVPGSWESGKFEVAYSMALYKGALYVGMLSKDGYCPAVFRYAQGRWEKVGGDEVNHSWPAGQGHQYVYELWSHQDGYLYAGLAGDIGCADVWRFNGSSWEQVGGDGVRGSWINPECTHVLGMTSYQGKLIASVNRNPVVRDAFTSIWAFDGTEWRPIGPQSVPEVWTRIHNFNFLTTYRGCLYAGAGGHPLGNSSVWELEDGGRWREVGGHGKLGSWGANGPLVPYASGTMEYVYRMAEYKGRLEVGFGDRPGAAQIWQYTPKEP